MKHLVPAAVLLGLIAAPLPAPACGFINDFAVVRTLRQDVADSQVVIYGKLVNAREGPGDGSTDCILETIIKPHPILRGKRGITLSRYLEIKDPDHPPRYLIFCDIYKGQIDPFRGVQTSSAIGPYLKGLLAIDVKNDTRRLRYCFDFLDHADQEIALDAFREFMKTPDRELGLAARKLPAAKLRRWLRDPKPSADRHRLYGFLLGNCGSAEDAVLLRSVADRLAKEKTPPQIDGILTGYTLLRPKEGWAHIRALLDDPSSNFMLRFAALRAARYFHNTRPDVIGEKAIVEAFKPALKQSDFADLAIGELRAWRCWDLTGDILPLYARRSHESPLMHRAIIAYALQCPGGEAATFIAERRKTDAELVKEVEEWLREVAKLR
jgi:hypothetical protein